MNDKPLPMTLDKLLGHGDFVRDLAKSLIFDETRVEDVVQQAWLAALRHPPKASENPRPWFAVVVRNTVKQFYRSENRLKKREEKAAKSEVVPADLVLEREELRREIVSLVLALDEPYRSALLFRFYENLSPTEIAERQELPLETVRTRIRRGLEKLREQLDRKHQGQREAWCLGLIPFAIKSKPAVAAASVGVLSTFLQGILTMSLASKVIGTVIVIGLGVGLWKVSGVTPKETASDTKLIAQSEIPKPPEVKEPEQAVVSRIQKEQSSNRQEISQGWRITGSVTEKNTQLPLTQTNIRLWLIDGEKILWNGLALSDAEGKFVLEFPEQASMSKLTASGLAIAPLHIEASQQLPLARLEPGQKNIELHFVLEKGASARGKIVDIEGKPVAGATVVLCERGDAASILRYSSSSTFGDGEYALNLQLQLTRSGSFEIFAYRHDIGIASMTSIELNPELDANIPEMILRENGVLAGRVVNADKKPVKGLELRVVQKDCEEFEICEQHGITQADCITGENGEFALRSLLPGEYLLKGFLLKSEVRFEEAQNSYPTGLTNLELVIENPNTPRLLILKLVDEHDQPIQTISSLKTNRWKRPPTAEEKIYASKYFPGHETRSHQKEIDESFLEDALDTKIDPKLLPDDGDSFMGKHRLKNGELKIRIDSAKLISVGISATDCALFHQAIEIPSGSEHVEAKLVLRKQAPPSVKVHIRLKNSESSKFLSFQAELTEERSTYTVTTIPLNPPKKTPSQFGWLTGDESGIQFLPPPGNYRVEIFPELWGRGLYKPIEKTIEIIEGKETSYVFETGKMSGGRIKLSLISDKQAPSSEQLQATYQSTNPNSRQESSWCVFTSEEFSSGGQVALDAPPALSKLLKPGSYILKVTDPEFIPIETSVTIEAGKITELTLKPERKK